MAAMTIRLDDDLYEWLRKVSFQTKEPMSRLIAYAILDYRDKQENQS